MKWRYLRLCLAILSLLDPRQPGYEMKILICTRNLKHDRGLGEARRINHRRATQVQKKPPPRKEDAEPTLFSQVIRSRRFRGNFTNPRRAGKGFSTRTRRALTIRKNSPSAKPWLFRSNTPPLRRWAIFKRKTAGKTAWSRFYSEQLLLPRNQQSCCVCFVRRDRLDRAARCDEGRLQIEFLRRPVPSAPQFFRPAHCVSTRSCSEAAAQNRPFRFGQSHCGSRCLAERLTATRGKMFVIRHASRDETRCRVQ